MKTKKIIVETLMVLALIYLLSVNAAAQGTHCKKFYISYGETDSDSCQMTIWGYDNDSLTEVKMKEELKNKYDVIDTLYLTNASHFVSLVPFNKFTALKTVMFHGSDSDRIQMLPDSFFENKNYKSISFYWVCVSKSVIDKLKKQYPQATISYDNKSVVDCNE